MSHPVAAMLILLAIVLLSCKADVLVGERQFDAAAVSADADADADGDDDGDAEMDSDVDEQ